MLYMILYAICIIIRKKVIKMKYSKLSFGDGSCLFSQLVGGGGGGRSLTFCAIMRGWVMFF